MTAETLSGGVQMEQPDVQSEPAQDSPGSEIGDAISQPEGQDVRMSGTRGSDSQSEGQTLEGGQTSVRTQSTNSQANAESVSPSESQTSPDERVLAAANRDDNVPLDDKVSQDDGVSEPAEFAATESPKVPLSPVESKDASTVGPKETGTEASTMPEVRVSTVGETSASSQRVGVQTQSQTTGNTSSTQTPVQSVGEQILDSVRASMANGDRQVSIRLLPPELGRVVVRFQEQGEQLNGVVEVSNGDTRREVERALPQVIRSLQEAGVQVRRVEVVTADQPDENPGGENLPQDVWQQHQGTGQGREHAYASQQTRWSQSLGGQSTVRQGVSSEEPRATVTQGRIDLLL